MIDKKLWCILIYTAAILNSKGDASFSRLNWTSPTIYNHHRPNQLKKTADLIIAKLDHCKVIYNHQGQTKPNEFEAEQEIKLN